MPCYYQSQPVVRGYRQKLHAFWKEKRLFQVREKELCDQVRMIQKKGWLSQQQLEPIRRLTERGGNYVEAQQEGQNQTGTKPIHKLMEQHITQNEEDKGRGEENSELLIKLRQYWHSKEATHTWNNCWANQERQLAKSPKPKKNWYIKLMGEVTSSAQTSNITDDNKLIKCEALVIAQLLGINERKNKKKEESFQKRRIELNINAPCKYVSLIEK